uniref:Uncharacterized protein n=1 Tax=Romanomermis culicivorax TaxID=13658 RepID=A0A915IPX0_ROMCU
MLFLGVAAITLVIIFFITIIFWRCSSSPNTNWAVYEFYKNLPWLLCSDVILRARDYKYLCYRVWKRKNDVTKIIGLEKVRLLVYTVVAHKQSTSCVNAETWR